ncbi:hypothetical protein G4B88_021909 [Cannabis sativa]|uniref:Agenet-like domain-containing protein n=1 Tax=Cannabis sativa TaxID=3483 RepID=A0A7J6DN70_CANSA|nr:hypothetical protein G4B88_021909 [Cannabis sativa]
MGLLWKSATMRKGYEGSWFKAKIIESLVDDNFWVEYKDLVTEDEVPQPLREKAKRRHIRPEPPLVSTISTTIGRNQKCTTDAYFLVVFNNNGEFIDLLTGVTFLSTPIHPEF